MAHSLVRYLNFVDRLAKVIRSLLGFAELSNINVEHNLGICGSTRFENIIECVRSANIQPGQGEIQDQRRIIDFRWLSLFREIPSDPGNTRKPVRTVRK